ISVQIYADQLNLHYFPTRRSSDPNKWERKNQDRIFGEKCKRVFLAHILKNNDDQSHNFPYQYDTDQQHAFHVIIHKHRKREVNRSKKNTSELKSRENPESGLLLEK